MEDHSVGIAESHPRYYLWRGIDGAVGVVCEATHRDDGSLGKRTEEPNVPRPCDKVITCDAASVARQVGVKTRPVVGLSFDNGLWAVGPGIGGWRRGR